MVSKNVTVNTTCVFFNNLLTISDVCTLNVTDVEAFLTSLVRKLPMYLKKGFKIQLGNFGRVKPSLSSKGFTKAEDVDASSITSKRILFTPSTELEGLFLLKCFQKKNTYPLIFFDFLLFGI
ncbi:hypothetical protein [Treponema sp.]|uniref:HU family DNA-binding protein n=1 Tax=Treponema sp. TaxID=166 RepID=UPI0025EBC314|nr:hypothetical protein [Treponema sp.]MBR4323629.1 hypothetical protein [Treponema sp.]